MIAVKWPQAHVRPIGVIGKPGQSISQFGLVHRGTTHPYQLSLEDAQLLAEELTVVVNRFLRQHGLGKPAFVATSGTGRDRTP